MGAMVTATPEVLSDSIRGVGLKVTESRLAVLKALESQPHADANTVFDSVKLALPGTSLQAVYGVLTALTSAGLLRKITPARSSARYELRTGDNHHHVVCTRCSAVQDVDCVVGEAPCLTPLHDSDFAIHTAEVTFWGLCPACQLTNT